MSKQVARYYKGKVYFECPGCQEIHAVTVDDQGQGPKWRWNKSVEKPTFTPSILCRKNRPNEERCHSFVTDGKIRFLQDCDHELKGQTVDLQEFEISFAGEEECEKSE